MKRLIFCLGLVFGLMQANHLFAQEGQFFSGTIPPGISIQSPSWFGQVLALQVYITVGSDPTPLPGVFQYLPGKAYYMNVFVANASNLIRSFKVEYNLAYNDGANYLPTTRYAYSAPAQWVGYCRINVTAYIAKLGLISLQGRVYGTGMGNTNKVCSQVIVYP